MNRTAVVIGCGKAVEGKEGWAIGHAHARGWRQADPALRLYAVDVNAENLAAFAAKFDLPSENLFSSTEALYEAVVPDFASVCTWPELHVAQVIEAAERGVRGIACEKPAAVDPGALRGMREKCARTGARLAIGHQRRHTPSLQVMKRLLQAGEVGGPWMLEARVPDGWDLLSWTTHWFDAANYLFGAPPVSILAGLQQTGSRRYRQAIEDESVVFATYPDNHQAVFITGPDKPLAPSLSIRGSDGLITVGAGAESVVEVFSRRGFASHQPAKSELDPFGAMLAELIAAVERGDPMMCDAAETAAATEMAYAAHESARTMRRVSFPVDFAYAPLEVVQHVSRPVRRAGRTVLYADAHFGSGGREGLAVALADTVAGEVAVVDAAENSLHAETLQEAELLVFYHTQKTPSRQTQEALADWVVAGRPLLLVHAALGAYPDWDAYRSWCGRVWVWGESKHPHEETRLVGRDGWPWGESWLPRDEVFIELGTSAPVDDLLEAETSTGRFPAAWTSREFPRVGVWVPGHRGDLWRVPAMREGLAEMIRRIIP